MNDSECDIERLFDDPHAGSRRIMKQRIQGLVEDAENLAYEVYYNNALAGCFLLYHLGGGTYECHITLKKAFRGLRGIAIGKQGTRFVLALPHVFQLVSFVPDNMKESLYYALSVGWKSLGRLSGKWVKNGKEFAMTGIVARRDGCLY